MSTADRYGQEVWRACVSLGGPHAQCPRQLMTVGDVAEVSGVSVNTAKKYLMDLVRVEVVAAFPVGRRWVYQYIGDGKDI